MGVTGSGADGVCFAHATALSRILKAKLCRPPSEGSWAAMICGNAGTRTSGADRFLFPLAPGNLKIFRDWWGEGQGYSMCRRLLSEVANVLAARFTACTTSPVRLGNETHHMTCISSGSHCHTGRMAWCVLVACQALNPTNGTCGGSPSLRGAP